MKMVSTEKYRLSHKNGQHALVFIAIVLSLTGWGVYRGTRLQKEGRYSVATIDKMENLYHGQRVYYSYVYAGDTIRNRYFDASGKHPKDYVGKRFLLRFLPEYRHYGAELLYGFPIHDLNLQAPENGWTTVPVTLGAQTIVSSGAETSSRVY